VHNATIEYAANFVRPTLLMVTTQLKQPQRLELTHSLDQHAKKLRWIRRGIRTEAIELFIFLCVDPTPHTLSCNAGVDGVDLDDLAFTLAIMEHRHGNLY
jgi:hypothetical protein